MTGRLAAARGRGGGPGLVTPIDPKISRPDSWQSGRRAGSRTSNLVSHLPPPSAVTKAGGRPVETKKAKCRKKEQVMWPLKPGEARSWGRRRDQHGKAPDRKKEAGLAAQRRWRDEGPDTVGSAVRSYTRTRTPLR